MIVNRLDQLETLIERRPRLCLIEYFVHGILPMSQVDVPFFRSFVSYVNPSIANDPPNLHQLRNTIIQRAVALRNCITPATSGSRFVSLIADGVRNAGCAWLGTARLLPANCTSGASFAKSTRRPRRWRTPSRSRSWTFVCGG
jgi:hypothetical protein